jgi:transcriptional regulator with XRE-family HTH domain
MSTENLQLFSERVKQRRQTLRLTLKEVADALGVAIATVAQYESGKNFAPRERLKNLSRVLQTTPEWLLGESDNGVLSESISSALTSPPWNELDSYKFEITGAVLFKAREVMRKEGFPDVKSLVEHLIRLRHEKHVEL